MENLFDFVIENTLTKLLFIIFLFFVIYHLYKTSKKQGIRLFGFLIVASLTLTLSSEMFSLKIIYPYGIILDLMILYWGYVLIFFSLRIKQPIIKKTSIFTIILLITIIPLMFAFYALSFKVAMQENDLYAIFQTNSQETQEFLIQYIPFYVYIFAILTLYVLLKLVYKLSKQSLNQAFSIKYIKSAISISILILLISPPNKNIYSFPFLAYSNYITSLKTFSEKENVLQPITVLPTITNKQPPSLHIIVIGESANKHHMSLYGYHRKTTPLLDKLKEENEIIVFNNAFSNHTQTMPVLELSLTSANQINKQRYENSPSLIQVLKAVNTKIAWLSNQQISGNWNTFTSILANNSHYMFHSTKAVGSDEVFSYDGQLLPAVQTQIKQWKQSSTNLVIFIHLQGSHTIYQRRYPKNFEKYQSPLITRIKDRFIKSIWGGGNIEDINHYDNSIYYSDHVLATLIQYLQDIPKLNASLVYFSDHGEDVKRGLGHSGSNFTYDMVQIPLLFWLSEKYKQLNPDKINALKNNTNALFSNDLVYDTVLGLYSIKLKKNYNKRFDLSDSSYQLDSKEALTMHGAKPYATPQNPFYKEK